MEIQEIITAIDTISQFENKKDTLIQEQSNLDLQTQDILHFIENEKFDAVTGYKLAKRLKEIRINRRKIKNELELINIFQNNSNKLINSSNREFLKSTLIKENKRIENSKYNYRVLKENEIKG